MRTLTIQAMLLTLASTGCTGEGALTTAPVRATLARAATTHHSVPSRRIGGRCETVFNPPSFPLPPIHRQIDTGICQLSHLGRTTLYSELDIDFATGTQSGETMFTAANGDLLRATVNGSSAPNSSVIRFSATMTFVGGTGRFANATGSARIEGTASLSSPTAAYTLDGHITY